MRIYEIIYVIRPDLTDQDVGTVRAEVKNKIETLDGSIEKDESWGKRQLAFEIKDFTEGVYNQIDCKLPPETPSKIRDQLKIDERIIRFMITLKSGQ